MIIGWPKKQELVLRLLLQMVDRDKQVRVQQTVGVYIEHEDRGSSEH